MVTLLDGTRQKNIGNVVSYECSTHPNEGLRIVNNGEVAGWFCIPARGELHLLAYEKPETVGDDEAVHTIQLLFEQRVREERALRREREQ